MTESTLVFNFVFIGWVIGGLVVATVLLSPFVFMIMVRLGKAESMFEEDCEEMAYCQWKNNPEAKEIFAHIGQGGSK